ncbi:MAG: aldolase/citrate lyase family protein [Dehalococcoidia bacterium]|nr:aldolase/citrate lyase family protein [Dehalococcoidia bacterium]
MLALRSTLVIDALDTAALKAAERTAADAVLIDLAHPSVHGQREEARALASRHARAIAKTGRAVLVRVSDTRSGEMEADVAAVVHASLAGVVVSAVEEPQDARDADVLVRKYEMRSRLTPGEVDLIPEIDAAEGLVALYKILLSVDRLRVISLSVDGLRRDLRLGAEVSALYDHAMAEVAIAADAARMPWIVHVAHHRPGVEVIPTRAHQFGAAGVTVHNEGEARGMNSLFAPDPSEMAIARAMVAEWARVRKRGGRVGVVAGEVPQAAGYDRLVDRRTVRRARVLLELAEAIDRREAIE